MQSGILHAKGKDYCTVYSYFFQAFENLRAAGVKGPSANGGKVQDKEGGRGDGDVNVLLTLKLANTYAQTRDVQSMHAVARAHRGRDLKEFGEVLREHRNELQSDPTIPTHLPELYEAFLKGSIKRVLESYSIVKIEYHAE
ncbi:putative 26S proteasome regulatory subunit rpn6 [Psilocybe cubensis]|uniref:26S proteasome regulatory subunit rpn6 n=1 Tax=Psilocybe cubensis TaxID=181762 RepID=A0ACB8GR74_PSICU|nr:putative 26S proteasome regulatory subunit rpn6 [Psilocybe cubensis]KAH9478133.1 putative 26S proteasome regulatory subunit rpn6 [Psilocybe cubensis]